MSSQRKIRQNDSEIGYTNTHENSTRRRGYLGASQGERYVLGGAVLARQFYEHSL